MDLRPREECERCQVTQLKTNKCCVGEFRIFGFKTFFQLDNDVSLEVIIASTGECNILVILYLDLDIL